MRVTVAMATYNGVRYLREQLESLARQTLLPEELVVYDDASIDDSVSVLESFQRESPFDVRIFRNEGNQGYADTFLRAALGARGEWVAFCDQDDIWLPQKLERCAEVANDFPNVVLVSHSAVQVDSELRELPWRIPNHRRFEVLGPLQSRPLTPSPGFSLLFRRSLLDDVPIAQRPNDYRSEGRPQNHDRFVFQLANTYGHVAYLPDHLVLYRRHPGAATGRPQDGVYQLRMRSRVAAMVSADPERLKSLGEFALSLCSYYGSVRRSSKRYGHDAYFMRKTDAAVDYYGRLSQIFFARAALHGRGQRARQRARILGSLMSAGAYDSADGRGLGWGALSKDIVHTALAMLRRP